MYKKLLLVFVSFFFISGSAEAACVGDTRCGIISLGPPEICDCANVNLSTHSCTAYPSCGDFDCESAGKCECASSCYAGFSTPPPSSACLDSAPSCDGGRVCE